MVPLKKLGDIRPCDTFLRNKCDETKLSQSMLIKPCNSIPGEKPDEATKLGQMMLLKPCDAIPKSSTKKRRLNQTEVEGEEFPAIKLKAGQHVDVVSLLSSKARDYLGSHKDGEIVSISSLVGNYVLVCGFYVPFDMDNHEARTCQSLEALFSHLSQQGIADHVKLVVAVMLDSGFNNEAAFDAFFSSLSVNCLVIPSFDSKSRHYVCNSLGFSPSMPFAREVPYLAVNPSGMVLQRDPCFLSAYGALSFPFTKQHFDQIRRKDNITKLRFRSNDSPMNLEQLLECDNVSRIYDETKPIPMSYFRDTPVGLYLYFDGAFMDKLQDIHKKCQDKDLKFEIVLVPLPFKSHCDPASFYKLVKQSALKDWRSSSWWTVPFNENICRNLWRLFDCVDEDQFVILPHGDCFGDLCGKHVASYYGINAYPFTRDAVVERMVNELRSLTVAFLLGDNHMEDIYNKNVLLYLDYTTISPDYGYIYETLEEDYDEIKLKYPGTEVFFVSLNHNLGSENPFWLNKSWRILPPDMCKSVIKHIFMKETYPDEPVIPALVAFGKDGKILSRSAQKRLPISTASASLFDDTLRSEILSEMEDQMW